MLFILSMQGGKILASGSGTAADGIIELAGGVNAVEGFAGYKQLADEAAIVAKPDIILMMDRGGGHGIAEAELFAHPAIAPTPAGAGASGSCAWTAAICSASARAPPAPIRELADRALWRSDQATSRWPSIPPPA